MASAKDSGMSAQFNRRALLKLAPMVPVAAAIGVPAVASEETPVMKLFREWEIASAEETRLSTSLPIGEREDVLVDAASEKRQSIENQMLKEKSRTAQDVLAKIASWTLYGEFTFDNGDERLSPVWDEIRAFVA